MLKFAQILFSLCEPLLRFVGTQKELYFVLGNFDWWGEIASWMIFPLLFLDVCLLTMNESDPITGNRRSLFLCVYYA